MAALAVLGLGGGCSRKVSAGTGTPPEGTCTDGDHRCSGRDWQVCAEGVFTTVTSCAKDTFCTDAVGCTPCRGGHSACNNDLIVACDDQGQPTSRQTMDCSPLTCGLDPETGEAACVTPCDPKALARSYTGCVYYAVDLPQWGLQAGVGFGAIASDQQFAVTVANPWAVAIDVVVEQNDAAVGTPPQIKQTMGGQVKPRSLLTLPLPQREVSGHVTDKRRNRTLRTSRAYRITTSRPASVYQFNPLNNPDTYSNDASLLIPQNALDESYLVLGWPGFGGDVSFGGASIKTDKRSFVTIVASRDNTKVRVTSTTEVMPGDNVPAIHKGKPYSVTLNEMEALNLEGADFATAGATDFTGTRIEADGPVAVWSGVECVTINPRSAMETCCCDHLEEQLFPRSSLGEEYVVVHSEARNLVAPDPEFFRILALAPGTRVTTSLPPPDDKFTLDAGQIHELMAWGDFIVTASAAVTIGQFQVSQDSSPGGEGDPSFELVPPVVQHRTGYIFLVPSGYGENYLLISAPTGSALMLDGRPASGCDRSPVGRIGVGTSYEAIRCPVDPGSHDLTSSARFGLVVEGWGPGPVSYGYTGGMEFKSVNKDCDEDFDCPAAEFCAGGACVPEIIIQ